MAMKIYTNTNTNNTTTTIITEDLEWQAIYNSCRCAQERFLYAELRIKGKMTPSEAKEYMSRNFHDREIVFNVESSIKHSKEVVNKEV